MVSSQMVDTGGRWVVRGSLVATLLVTLGMACTSVAPTPSPTMPAAALPGPTTTAGPTGQPILYDFGDASDPSYPTLLASDGARTRDISQFWLGNLRSPSVTNELEAKVVNLDELDDGMEGYATLGAATSVSFRAVKSSAAAAGTVYFNLLVDFGRDGRWQGGDWVVRNRALDLAPGEEKLIEASVGLIEDAWTRATLTDTEVAAADWDGTGEFAKGEVEDYYLPLNPPYTPPPTQYPTPSYTPTPSPTPERTIHTGTPGPTTTPSPSFVYTGDFVVECRPWWDLIEHGESVSIALRLVSGEVTPPERFRVQQAGGAEGVGGTISTDPPAGADGWSAWGNGASVTFTSTHVDPPPRLERQTLVVTLQSLSTTRTISCAIDVIHRDAIPSPTQISTPVIHIEPEIVTLSLTSQVPATVRGTGFAAGGQVDIRIKPPNHPATNVTKRAGTDGQFSLDLHFQPGMPKGTWQVTATDRATGQVAEATITVR